MNGRELLNYLRMAAESENPFAEEWVRKNSGGFATYPNPFYPTIQGIADWFNTPQQNIDTTAPMQKYYNSAQYQLDKMRGYRY